MLRSDPGRAGINSIREEMEKLAVIRRLELPDDIFAHGRAHEHYGSQTKIKANIVQEKLAPKQSRGMRR